MAENKKNIAGFKKFSDINSKSNKSKIEEINPSLEVSPEKDSDRPMNPNFNYSKKEEAPASTKDIKPEVSMDNDDVSEEKVETYGKVAKFPKNVKASKAYNFLENVKVSKKSIWYIMVEKMDNELQMVKYNYKEGVDLNKFVNELKSYYIGKYSSDPKVCKLIEGIVVDGNDKYSMVKNIPLVEVDGKKMISIITQDLIRLLSK
jgi:hypothetical protein